MNNLIRVDGVDTLHNKFIYKHKFASFKTCKYICEHKNLNVFIIDQRNNMVYYKKPHYNELLFGLKLNPNTKLYIYSKNMFLLTDEKRLERYTIGIKEKSELTKKSQSYEDLIKFINNIKNSKRHIYNNYKKFIQFIKSLQLIIGKNYKNNS